MPVMWKCPGQPHCRKIYLYARGLKAHIPSCKHARKKEVHKKRSDMETMLTIILFVEDQQKGNITMSRLGVPSFQIQRPVFSRYPPVGDRSRLCREPLGGYPFLEERRTNANEERRTVSKVHEERRTNANGISFQKESRTNGYPFPEERRIIANEERRTNANGYPFLEERRPNIHEERRPYVHEERRPNIHEERRPYVHEERRPYVHEERRPNIHEERRPYVHEERRTNVHGYPSYYSSSYCSDSYRSCGSYGSYGSSSSSTQYMRDIRQPLPSIGQLATR